MITFSSSGPLERKLRADMAARQATERQAIHARLLRRIELSYRAAEKIREAKRRIMEEQRSREATPKEAVKRIQREVARKHQLKPNDIIVFARNKRLVEARQEAMFRCADETILSYPKIGALFGDRDHTTIIHGVRAHAVRIGLPVEEIPRGLKLTARYGKGLP